MLASSPPTLQNEHALRLLRDLGYEAERVVCVCSEELPEAILYVSRSGRARTVWVERKNGRTISRGSEAGFPAFHPSSTFVGGTS